ncbi:hypothetical protein T06_10148 [Trichinella sp. T6]|nr:hypothetical protein T06_10148 [Trichinella sp. T6]
MVLHCLVCATACLMVAFDFDMSNQYCRPLWQSEYAQVKCSLEMTSEQYAESIA